MPDGLTDQELAAISLLMSRDGIGCRDPQECHGGAVVLDQVQRYMERAAKTETMLRSVWKWFDEARSMAYSFHAQAVDSTTAVEVED